ncbi:MAG: rhomboid family intramembrane serine protease [Candidatus Micrarchaeia archaeon]
MISFYLIGLMFLAFFLEVIPGFTEMFIFDPAVALTQPWRFFTSIFLHADLTHIFFNMLALFMFGPILESRIGTDKFIMVFFAGGIIGSLLYYITIAIGIAPPIPALGASGAIYAILGALAVLTPDLVVYLWFIPMRMSSAAIVWVILEFLGTFNPYSGVASAAHLGGLVFGWAYAKMFEKGSVLRTRWQPEEDEEEFEFYK